MSKEIVRTERTKIRRLPKRGNFERDAIYKILDEAFICHVGFTVDDQPFGHPDGLRESRRLFNHSRLKRESDDAGDGLGD